MKCYVQHYGVILMNKDRYVYGYEVSLNVPSQSIPVITDTLNRKQYYSLREVIELLNGYEMLCLMLININSELHDTITKNIHKDEISINTMMSNMEKLEEENEQLRKDKEILKERLRECRVKMDKFNCR